MGMILTNVTGLPEPLVRAIKRQEHRVSPGALSATQVIGPPRIRVLKLRHDYEVDVSEMIWLLLGKAVHSIVEDDGANTEVLLETPVGRDLLCGTLDHISRDGLISDYKCTSVWGIVLGDKPEWEAQLNCYAHLARENGLHVSGLQIVALLRDWQQSKRMEEGYPLTQVQVLPIPMWGEERVHEYLLERFRLHREAEEVADEDLPLCTEEERWYRPGKVAVYKGQRKRAERLFDTPEEALAYTARRSGYRVEVRPGESVRCQRYCEVREFCPGRPT